MIKDLKENGNVNLSPKHFKTNLYSKYLNSSENQQIINDDFLALKFEKRVKKKAIHFI